MDGGIFRVCGYLLDLCTLLLSFYFLLWSDFMQQLFRIRRHNVFLHWCPVLIYISLCFVCCFPLCFCIYFLIRLHAPAVVSDAMMQCLPNELFLFFLLHCCHKFFVYPSKSTDNCYPRAVKSEYDSLKRLLMFWLLNVFIVNAQNASKQDILLQQEGMFHR